jgi:uncharacterized protein YkwD
MGKVGLACLLLVACASLACADVVRLRDGRPIEGETRWVDGGRRLRIETTYGAVTVDKADVLDVQAAERSPQAEVRERERGLAADDWAGRLELARFALDNDVREPAERLLRHVAGCDEEALATAAGELLEQRCDYHLVEGEWLAPKDYYAALGYLKVDGEWVPPEQAPFDALRKAYAARVLELVNVERRAAGLKPLKRDKRAERAAQVHAEDMGERNFFAHESPEGTTPRQRAKRAKCRMKSSGENIAVAQETPAEVMESWMNSPGHRRNILSPKYTHLGVGLARGAWNERQDCIYWVQVFLGR